MKVNEQQTENSFQKKQQQINNEQDKPHINTINNQKKSFISNNGNQKQPHAPTILQASKNGKIKEQILETENNQMLNTLTHQEKETFKTIIEDNDDGFDKSTGFEDGRKTKSYFGRYLLIDQAVSSFSFLSVIITVINYELEYNETKETIAISMLWATTVLTIGMLVLTFVRYQAKLTWLKTRKVISEKQNIITSGFILPLTIELILNAVHPMPWTWNIRIYFVNEPSGNQIFYYHVNEILTLIMLLRVILIIRTLLMMSEWYNNRTQRVCNMYACEADYLFVIKCIMKTYPYFLIISAMAISIFVFAFAIKICESPIVRDTEPKIFYNFLSSMWNIIVTMTTVGYGDMSAKTHLGRFVIFFVCIWGVFIVSMMVITLNNTLQTTTLENKAIAVLDRLQLKGEMRESAGMVLTLLARIEPQVNEDYNNIFLT
ncbi:small-conductance calcium-activated potassium channel protein, putative [Ichthyophthirius multifiliis]|uniref:Small-conductance calcium-activated potassium channel protein, putative n=1 Tax=Ichthyophthirius multifiliis TaxID=5932 RepID=G0R109_ICHMU|nr:small-conductance calcium-activated potassium channel protein, putative [Ichthyophthirius multifiliis]EGR28840.1 small-conductance calcium-activated potassium channel protein, putative [Ichthyophthirius multifiliis]|eukprot:XP_004030076.1 small-conductance calcium-activated potassium channel protein, putative [Ichthyophthirius multifiliis]